MAFFSLVRLLVCLARWLHLVPVLLPRKLCRCLPDRCRVILRQVPGLDPAAGFLVFVVVPVGFGVAVLVVSGLCPWLCALALLPAVVVPLVVAACADRRPGGRGPWPGRGRLLAKRKINRRMVVFGPGPGACGVDRLR